MSTMNSPRIVSREEWLAFAQALDANPRLVMGRNCGRKESERLRYASNRYVPKSSSTGGASSDALERTESAVGGGESPA